MSALGQKQTSRLLQGMSALLPKADIGTQSRNVCFVPIADIRGRSRDQIYWNGRPRLLKLELSYLSGLAPFGTCTTDRLSREALVKRRKNSHHSYRRPGVPRRSRLRLNP